MTAPYQSTLISRASQKLWWLGPAALGLICGAIPFGWKLIVVSLMIILIILPGIMMLIAMKYMTRRDVAMRSRANRFVIKGNEIWAFEDHGDDTTLIEHDKFINVTFGKKYDCFIIGKGVADFILVPEDQVSDAIYEKFS